MEGDFLAKKCPTEVGQYFQAAFFCFTVSWIRMPVIFG
jgi:hypothetical protein